MVMVRTILPPCADGDAPLMDDAGGEAEDPDPAGGQRAGAMGITMGAMPFRLQHGTSSSCPGIVQLPLGPSAPHRAEFVELGLTCMGVGPGLACIKSEGHRSSIRPPRSYAHRSLRSRRPSASTRPLPWLPPWPLLLPPWPLLPLSLRRRPPSTSSWRTSLPTRRWPSTR